MLDNRLTISGKHLFYDYEKITVSDEAIGLTASKLTTERKPISVFITVENAQIRWRADGKADPTSTEGHLSNPSASFTLEGIGLLTSIRFIRTGSDAVLRVSYRR